MKSKHSSVVLLSCLLTLIQANWARNLQAGTPNSNVTKHVVDMKPTARQDISYNLDLVNRNGSSALMYSEPNEAINGDFTDWSTWSECSNECGKRTLRSRERYCTNPPPSNGGADCIGERFQLSMCEVKPCSSAKTSSPKQRHVIGKFGQWSGWSKCRCGIGYQKRYRQCNSHHGSCFGRGVERRTCNPRGCKTPVPEEKSSLVDIDPKQFCGFNPCDISKCLLAPLGSCVSDYKCRPVFFDENNKRIEGCVGEHIYIGPAQVAQVCKINPCHYTRCLMDFTEERCVVGTKCQAVYYSAEGQPQKCTAVLKIPARQVCGYDPCNGESCQDNPNARCLVTSRCRPVFVNSFNERIRKCEEEAASRKARLDETKQEEFEAEPDDSNDDDQREEDDNIDGDSIDSDDDDSDDDDDSFDANSDDDRYDDERYSYLKNLNREQYDNVDDDQQSEATGRHDYDDDDDVDFKTILAKAKSRGPHHSQPHTENNRPNPNMLENSKNFSNPLFKLLNVENGERRSRKPDMHDATSSINPSSFNLEDLVSGKLDNSSGLIVGTMKKSMKILSNKKPTTYYYFETKGNNPKENRQFMVITAPKTKKSAVHPKRFV